MDFTIKNETVVYRPSEEGKILNLDYHLTDRCNLNCACCGHFCPLVPTDVKSISFNKAKEELDLLYDVTEHGSRINLLTLTGGEVTLNPDLYDIVAYAIKLFPYKLRIWSNGILSVRLIGLKDLLQTGKVEVFFTNYQQSFTDNAIKTLKAVYPGGTFNVDKSQDSSGKVCFTYQFFSSKPVASISQILNCEARQYCGQYVDGKIYVCQYFAYFKYFDAKFKGQHKVPYNEGEGYIDLRNRPSVDEILRFTSTYSSKFCSHCIDCTNNKSIRPWTISKRMKDEWYREETE